MNRTDIYATLEQAYFSEDPHEKAVLDHLPLLLRDGARFVDVGASLGQYTRAVSRHVRDGRICAIEADPLRVDRLERNCRQWSAESGNVITVKHLALTDHTGTVPYYVTNSAVSGGLIRHDTPHPVQWEQKTIQCSTLDDLFPSWAPDLVKIDVEGAEANVLAGAHRILRRGQTNFLIELHEWAPAGGSPAEVIRAMRALGYVSVPFFGISLFTRSRPLALKLGMTQLQDPRRAMRAVRNRLARSRPR